LFERGKILLNDIKILVIDEADRMLDMGFIPDIEKIVSKLPPMRQTLLFSATMPPEIQKLTQKFQSNPRQVSVAPPASTAERVEQFLVRTSPKDKKQTLDRLIQSEDVQNAFIFCNRKRDVDDLARWLIQRGYSAKALHGDMVQKIRTQTLLDFKEDRLKLLVCSDVAGRGLDIDGMSHVFNYDVPMHADDYVHRIGRTGRAGKTGRAWMLATENDEKFLEAIEKLIKKPIPVVDVKVAARSESDGGRSDRPRERKEYDRPPHPQRPAPAPVRHNNKSDDDGPSVQGFGDELPGFFTKR
jgi:superfamily II DNA/RNA helicase